MKTHRFYYKSLSLFMSLSHPYHSRHPYLFQYEPSSLQSLFHPVLDLYRLCFIFPPFSITYTSCTLVKSLILTFSPFLIYVFAGLHQLSPSCPSILKRSLAYVPGYLFIVFFFFLFVMLVKSYQVTVQAISLGYRRSMEHHSFLHLTPSYTDLFCLHTSFNKKKKKTDAQTHKQTNK